MDGCVSAQRWASGRTSTIDYCNNASSIYHIEPIDDIVIREWDAGANLVELLSEVDAGHWNALDVAVRRFQGSGCVQRAAAGRPSACAALT